MSHHSESEPLPHSKRTPGPSDILAQNVCYGRKHLRGDEKSSPTQKEFARQVCITVNELKDIEVGKGNPDLGELIRIAAALEVGVDKLFVPKAVGRRPQ